MTVIRYQYDRPAKSGVETKTATPGPRHERHGLLFADLLHNGPVPRGAKPLGPTSYNTTTLFGLLESIPLVCRNITLCAQPFQDGFDITRKKKEDPEEKNPTFLSCWDLIGTGIKVRVDAGTTD